MLLEVKDMRDNLARAKNAVDDDVSVKVWNKKQGRAPTPFRQLHDRFDELVCEASAWAKEHGLSFSSAIAYGLSKLVEKAVAVDYRDEDGFHKTKNGCIQKELKTPGCRIWMTQTEMAERLGCSRSTLSSTLRALKEVELVVNWGNGWIEFDCLCVWRGEVELKNAYHLIQKIHPSKRITIKGD